MSHRAGKACPHIPGASVDRRMTTSRCGLDRIAAAGKIGGYRWTGDGNAQAAGVSVSAIDDVRKHEGPAVGSSEPGFQETDLTWQR